MKILRLSMFNLKKNKYEAMVILFLTMVTTLMLSIFVANNSKVDNIFTKSFEKSGSKHYVIAFREDKYRDLYEELLREYVKGEIVKGKMLYSIATDCLDVKGEMISYNMIFMTERLERGIENFVKRDSLSEEEIHKISHPIWLPVAFQIKSGYSVGENFVIVKGGQEYPFTIVGFYETGLHSSDGYGYKAILSEVDYELFATLFKSEKAYTEIALAFDTENKFSLNEYIDKCSEEVGENVKAGITYTSFETEKNNETQMLKIFLMLIVFLAAVTLIAAGFMIWNKVSNDIEDQMQQIGVLEALGYRSKEISFSYLGEYLVLGGIGSVFGGVIALLITPVINSGMEKMLGRRIYGDTGIRLVGMVALIVLVFVIGIALLKARCVKNYPPVVAFRRGIRTHHFGKNIFPMEKTKGNVNLRLAMKGIVTELRSEIGIMICIITAGMAILFSSQAAYFFKDGTKGLETMLGVDSDTERVRIMSGVDIEAIRDEFLTMPEVRKALISYDMTILGVKGSEDPGAAVVYKDFKDAENFAPFEGRFPEHDNEIMIGIKRARTDKLSVGDSLVLESNGMEKKYVITGLVSSIYNGGTGLYLTEEGFRRISMNTRPDTVMVFLEDGVDSADFQAKLEEIYGGSAKNGMGASAITGSLEDKISATAEEKIATLLNQYGVTSVDYAVQIGDEMITGNSRQFIVKEITSWRGSIKSQLAPIATTTESFSIAGAFIISLIVGVIFWSIASSNVKRQRHSLGIMKGLGYSSKDLMTQMALRTLPVTVIGMIIASFLAVWVNGFFWRTIFSLVADTKIWLILIEDVILIIFTYLATYLGARKIKKISVTELMTE